MKIDGKEVNKESALYGPFVIVRGDDKFGFWAQPVWDFKEFNKLCPVPEPPPTGWNAKTGKREADPKSPAYQQAITEYQNARWGYVILKSLEPSNLEIDGISLEDPKSWGSVETRLREELSHFEFGQVIGLVEEANSLDPEKMEANRESFLLEAARSAAENLSQNGEPSSSKSGKLATDGE